MSVSLNTKATAAALLVVAGLSLQAQAKVLTLRCEGTGITTERKEPDGMKELFPKQSVGEEGKGTKDALSRGRVSTVVIVTDRVVNAFGTQFEPRFKNDAFVRFGRFDNNPKYPQLSSKVSSGR
jgi:hypothetical protein